MMKTSASQVTCALLVVCMCSGVICLPSNFAIVHGKRSVDLEQNEPETQFYDRTPLKTISRYLDPEYELIEDESPFRRNEPEVPTKVAHMFGRTLDDEDLSSAFIDSLRVNNARAMNDFINQPYDEESMLQERLLETPRTMTSKYNQHALRRNLRRNSPYNRGPDSDYYRYLAGILNPSTRFEDERTL